MSAMVAGNVLPGHAPAFLAVILGLVLSVIAYAAAREHNRSQTDVAFTSQASNHANAIVNGFSHAFFAIESVGALYRSSGDVSWYQFVAFVTPLLERFPTVAAMAVPHEKSPVAKVVTISIGFGTALPTPGSSVGAFLQAVDAALYRAKQQGRNRTVAAAFAGDRVSDGPGAKADASAIPE